MSATGEEGETESSSGEEAESDDDEDAISETESEEADSNAENGRGEASVIADTLGSLEDPLTQVEVPVNAATCTAHVLFVHASAPTVSKSGLLPGYSFVPEQLLLPDSCL